jgi:hypothetical protein
MRRVLVLAAFFAAELAAQPVYKSTLPDGRVIYGDRPDPAAVKVEESTPDTSARGIGGLTPQEAQALREMEAARLRRESDDAKVQSRLQALQKAVADAEAAQADGKEPLPGEHLGTVGGGARLNDSYWARQRSLDEAVEKARRELDAARAAQ